MHSYLEKLCLKQRVDDPNIPSNAFSLTIDFDDLKRSRARAMATPWFDSYD